uniref:Uncharacterized protein n=1 Tax=Anguilla anguilla TaxID=7936 RepID=A0A0E9SEZ8_ANGAN
MSRVCRNASHLGFLLRPLCPLIHCTLINVFQEL